MFGMGGSEIIVILVIALIFLGPEKLPDAAKSISKGIRDLRGATKEISQTIENDEQIGGALRDIKSALRGEEVPARPKPRLPKKPPAMGPTPAVEAAAVAGGALVATAESAGAAAEAGTEAVAETGTETGAEAGTEAVAETGTEAGDAPSIRLPDVAGERDLAAADDGADLAALIRPAAGIVGRGAAISPAAEPVPAEPTDKPAHG
jgi:sec-independent protein translocase protein TatB